MAPKHYGIKICSGFTVLFMIAFIIIAIVVPGMIENTISSTAVNMAIMSGSNYESWGQVPGKLNATLIRNYTFFNFVNPFESIFLGEIPKFLQSPAYCYYEYQNFSDINFSIDENGNYYLANFHFQDYNIPCEGNTQEDLVTIVNLGPMGLWFNLKNASTPTIALNALGNLILGIESLANANLESQGFNLLNAGYNFSGLVLNPANITDNATIDAIVNDPYYGMNSIVGLQNWVQAWIEFNQSEPTSTTYLLTDYFKISYEQVQYILGADGALGQFFAQENPLGAIVCSGLPCTPEIIAGALWTRLGGYAGLIPSLTSTNFSLSGYPDIYSYFTYIQNNGTIPANWTFEFLYSDVFTLFNTTPDAGSEYCSDPATLLNIANMEFFFDVGFAWEAENGVNNITNLTGLTPIMTQFIPNYDLEAAFVLWSYVKYMGSDFALQRHSNYNGTFGDAGLGVFGSQAVFQSFIIMEQYLHLELLSTIIEASLTSNLITCNQLFTNSIAGVNATAICADLNASTILNITIVQDLIQACWQPYSFNWVQLQNLTGLTDANLQAFCNTPGQDTFATVYSTAAQTIHDHYNCSGTSVCSNYELAVMQWGASNITLNPIPGYNYTSSYSVSTWNPALFPTPIEYLGVLQVFNQSVYFPNTSALAFNYTMARNLTSFNLLFNPQVIQQAFLLFKNGNTSYVNQTFGVSNYTQLQTYLRYMIIEVAFQGFVQTRTVNELLWGYTDPVLVKFAQTSPLLGGDPSTATLLAFGGQNTSYEQSQAYPTSMYTGAGNSSNLRRYDQVYGYDNIMIPYAYFNGSAVVNTYTNPWGAPVELVGTDAFINPPGLSTDQNISLYVFPINFQGQGFYTGTDTDYNGVNTRRYHLTEETTQNVSVNPANSIFNMYEYYGMVNLSTVQRLPVYITRAHFYQVDPRIQDAVQIYSDEALTQIIPPTSADDLYLDIEPYSGASLGAMQRLQTCYGFAQDDLFTNQNFACLPVFYIERGSNISDSAIDANFGALKTGITVMNLVLPISLAIAGVLLLLLGFLIYKLYIYNKEEQLNGSYKRQSDAVN